MQRISFGLSTLALLVAGALPAASDTLAAEIWEEWQAQATLSGQTVTATATPTDTGLVLTNFTTTFEEEDVMVQGIMDRIEMVENADGTLSVAFSELYSMVISFEVGLNDPRANIELLMEHENLDVTVSGDAGARSYVYTADRILVTDGRIWGGDGPPPTIDLEIEMTGLASTYDITGTGAEDDVMRFSSTGSAEQFSMVLDVLPPPGEEGRLKAGMTATGIEGTSAGTILSLAALNQLEGQVPPGLELSGTTSYDGVAFEMAFEDPSENFAVAYSNDGGRIGFDFSETSLSYDIAATGMRTRISAADLPVPIDVSVGSSELQFRVPLAADDAPQDVTARIAYQDMTMSDAIWGMFDPGGAIPRDPASVILDATGQVLVLVDLLGLDPEAMTAPPGELRALTVNEMRVALGGAELTGTADMTFAPNQPMPMPVGSADLQLSGGNALLDALIAGGLVPAEQGAFVRGAANAFARPGATPDTLESTIEFGADGSITANGLPLQ